MIERTVVAGIGTIPVVGGPLSSWIFDYRSEQAIEDAEFRLRLRLGRAEDSIRALGQDFRQRVLSSREDLRVGKVLASAITTIDEGLTQGKTLRDDGFFDSDESGRSDAEEVGEHILLKSQREPEEKKLPYMAHLLANIAFDASISAHMAHQIIKSAEQLTYRQLCILCLAALKDRFELCATDYRGQGKFGIELMQVLYECLGLYDMAYINFGGEVAFGPTDVKPASMTVQGLGAHTYNLMRLKDIPHGDIVPLVGALS